MNNPKVIPFPVGDTGALTCLDTIEAKPVWWLRENHLARGHLTLVGGDPGKGKSQIAIDTSARLSKGVHWPNGPRAPIGKTIFLCSEDGLADTVKPRAEAAGADTSMMFSLKSTILKDGKLKSFTLRDDLDMLGDAVTRVGASLVCMDAITSYMGKVDNSSTTDVRAVLDPLSQWAEKLSVALLGVTHPPKAAQKNAIRQFTGSLAYVASARLAFFSMDDPDQKGRILFLAVKNNLGPYARGRGYRIATKTVSHGITAPYRRP
jgi:RecA-family ATPase